MDHSSEIATKNDQSSSEVANQKILMDSYFQSQGVQSVSPKTGASDSADVHNVVLSKPFRIPRKQSQPKEAVESQKNDNKTIEVKEEEDKHTQFDTKNTSNEKKYKASSLDTKIAANNTKEKKDKDSKRSFESTTNVEIEKSPFIDPHKKSKTTFDPNISENDETKTKENNQRSLEARPIPNEVYIRDESRPYGNISSKNSKILIKLLAAEIKKIGLTSKAYCPQFLGTSLENGKLIVTCADPASSNYIADAIGTMSPPWPLAKLKVNIKTRDERFVAVTVSEKIHHVSELLAMNKQNPNLSTEKWRCVSYEKCAKGKLFTLGIDLDSFNFLKKERGIVRCRKNNFIFDLDPAWRPLYRKSQISSEIPMEVDQSIQ